MNDRLALTTRPRCQHVSPEGKACRGFATSGDFCPWHNPAVSEEEKRAWRERGGIRAATRNSPAREPGDVSLRHPEDCLGELEAIMARVEKGDLSARTAQTMIAAVRAAHDVLELAVVAKRLKLLERKLGI